MIPLSLTGSGDLSFGIFFYSTFFTSAWIWLYALSGLALKTAQHIGLGINCLKNILDIENKPIRSMGIVTIVLVSLLFLVIPFFR